MNEYKYARYVGFGSKVKYWIKYTDSGISGGTFPGISAAGYAFLDSDGKVMSSLWNTARGFFPFGNEFVSFQSVKYKSLPKELKGKA